MATTDPLDADLDPSEDTPEPEDEDTAEADDAGSGDWESRYKEAQKLISRQGQELSLLRQDEPEESVEDDEDDEDGSDDDLPDPALSRLESQSWDLVRLTYGEDAVDAYGAFYRVFNKAQTPADVVAALEAYVDVRSGKTKETAPPKKVAAEPGTRGGRVDTNRTEPSPDSDEAFAEARKSGKLEDFTSAASAALGFGPSRRR